MIGRLCMAAALLGLLGCVTPQSLRDGGYTTADCTLHTAVSCAMQAVAGCALPSVRDRPGWKGYGRCLFDRAKDCQLKGLARCTIAGIMTATGGPYIGGGAGCDVEAVRLCYEDVEVETQMGAVQAVGGCYRAICAAGTSED